MKTSRSIEASKGADPSHSGHGVEASRASSSDDGTAQRGGSLSRRGSRTSLPRTSSARPAKSVTLPEGKAFLVVTLLFLLSLIMAAHLFRPRDILLDVDEMDLPMTVSSGFGNVRLEPPDAGHQHAGQAAVRAAQGAWMPQDRTSARCAISSVGSHPRHFAHAGHKLLTASIPGYPPHT